MRVAIARLLFIAVCVVSFARCHQPKDKWYDEAAFHSLLANYWEGMYHLKPMDATVFGDYRFNGQFVNTCTQQYRQQLKDFYKHYQDSLKAFNPAVMGEEDALSYKVLQYDCNMETERSRFDSWKIPFTQFGDAGNTLSANMPLAMGQYGSGASAQPFKTVKDYDDWLLRIHAYTQWCDSAIGNFRQGIASGYVLPKALVVKMIDICNGLTKPKAFFTVPSKTCPRLLMLKIKNALLLPTRPLLKMNSTPRIPNLLLF